MVLPEFTVGNVLLIGIPLLLVLSFVVQFAITRFRLRRVTLREPQDERYEMVRGEPVQMRDDDRLLVDRVGFLRQQWFVSSGAIEKLSKEEMELLTSMRTAQTGRWQQLIRNLKIGIPGVATVVGVVGVLIVLQPEERDISLAASVLLVFTTVLVLYYFALFPLLERRRIYQMDDSIAKEHGYEELAKLLERIMEANGEYPRAYTLLFPSMQQRIDRLREAAE